MDKLLFGNSAGERRNVAFASPYPGRIIPLDLPSHNNRILCQKDAFLCAAKGVSVGIAFQRKLGAGLFGGEGLFFASLTGPGKVWIQSLPFSRLASRVFAAAAQGGGASKGEGSVLGGLGGLVMGDRR